MWVALGVVVLLGAAAAIPLEIGFSAGSGIGLEMRLVWLFGLCSVRVSGRTPHQPRASRKARSPRKRKAKPRALVAAMFTPGLLPAVGRYLRRLSACVGLRLHATAEVGLGDPADTGELFGALSALTAMPCPESVRLDVTPNFLQEGFSGRADGFLRFAPLRLLVETIRFALSGPPLRAAVRALRA